MLYRLLGDVKFTVEVTVRADDEPMAKVALVASVQRTITDALDDNHIVSDFAWTDIVLTEVPEPEKEA